MHGNFFDYDDTPRQVMVIPLKKEKPPNPKSKKHPMNWHFDKPIVQEVRRKSRLGKRINSAVCLNKSQITQRFTDTRATTSNNSNLHTERDSEDQTKQHRERIKMIKSKSMSVLTPYGVKNMVAADSTIKINKLKINNNHRVFVKTRLEKNGASEKRQESARTRLYNQF